MRFTEHLSSHLTPEWRKQYIAYEDLKQMLYEAVDQAPSQEVMDEGAIQRFYTRFDENFFQYCDLQLAKINNFFNEKLSEARLKYADLKGELEIFCDHAKSANRIKNGKLNFLIGDGLKTRKSRDLKLAFSEFYFSLILLQNYQNLNFEGFRKILKKHDKLFSTDSGAKWRQANVDTSYFYVCKDINQLILDTEQEVICNLEDGNRRQAMKRLKVPPLEARQNAWTTFRLGLFVGVFTILIIIIIVSAHHIKLDDIGRSILQMFRGSFLVVILCFLVGLNTYGWRTSGVNHVLIFELDPRSHLSYQQLLEIASLLAVGWAGSVLLCLFSEDLSISPFVSPLMYTSLILVFLFNPIHIFYYEARIWLLRVLFRIITAPFHSVGFADFWIADQLNSLAIVFMDFEFIVCYYAVDIDWTTGLRNVTVSANYTTGIEQGVCGLTTYGIRAMVSCLPAWFRFAQCLRRYRDSKKFFPHVVNALKYSTTFLVVLFGTLYKSQIESGIDGNEKQVYFYLWVISKIISSSYTLTWDIKMDWGLLSSDAGDNKFLRDEYVYSYKVYYYVVMIEDLILRFIWVVSIIVLQSDIIDTVLLHTILACLEVIRRFFWNFFRLENEHLNNCGEFRAVRDISIVPIESNDLSILLRMMDDTDRKRVNPKTSTKKFKRRATLDEIRIPMLDKFKSV